MRALIGVIMLAGGLALGSTASTLAAPAGIDILRAGGPEDVVERVQFDWRDLRDWGRRHCERLRHACINKEERGEVGEGNCRRYRAECGGRVSYCERLRRACIYKEERGEVGEGNCRRYRNECGGRR